MTRKQPCGTSLTCGLISYGKHVVVSIDYSSCSFLVVVLVTGVVCVLKTGIVNCYTNQIYSLMGDAFVNATITSTLIVFELFL